MLDSRLNHAEWRWQPLFIKLLIAGAFLLLASDRPPELPDRKPMPARTAALTLEPVRLPPDLGGGVRITGAWKLRVDDPRPMGLSALAVLPNGRLQAITDGGVLVTFPAPGGSRRALVTELAGGPGYPTYKKFRDSEAMLVSPDGTARLVAFENQHSVWRYDGEGAGRALAVRLPSTGWAKNEGIEAMVRDPADSALLLVHEGGRFLLRLAGLAAPQLLPLHGATGQVADAVRLPGGRMVAAVRGVGPLGLTNRLAWLERKGAGYRLRNFATLPLGPLDNVEGLAAEVRADGGTLLWAVTDGDGRRRTLLLRMALGDAPAKAGASAS